jgi:hypothetical protein
MSAAYLKNGSICLHLPARNNSFLSIKGIFFAISVLYKQTVDAIISKSFLTFGSSLNSLRSGILEQSCGLFFSYLSLQYVTKKSAILYRIFFFASFTIL